MTDIAPTAAPAAQGLADGLHDAERCLDARRYEAAWSLLDRALASARARPRPAGDGLEAEVVGSACRLYERALCGLIDAASPPASARPEKDDTAAAGWEADL